MKKTCALFIALACSIGLFGCAKEQPAQPSQPTEHQHAFGDWILQAAARCTAEGREDRRCECGFAESRAIPKTPHETNGQNVCKTCHRVEFDEDATVAELGVVCDAWYGIGTMANYVWDIRVWNGKVYRAAGDYDTNSGDTTILAYDIANRIWDTSYRAKDEAIHGFEIINGTLCAPGIDARESWNFGNYYMLDENGKWQQVRNLPNGVHCFDMIDCDNKIFAGLGTEAVKNTVAMSTDGGKTFQFVPLYKDGQPLDLSTFKLSRTYEFVQLNGKVYALVYFQTKTGYARWWIFGYEDGKMHYTAEGNSLLEGSSFNRKYFSGEFALNGTCYLASRRLYAIKDFSDPTSWQTISMPNSGKVSDAILRDGVIYVLSSRQDSKTKLYRTIIYKSTTGEPGSFEECASYDYSGFPMSFDYDGTHFYVGTGSNNLDGSKIGMVLRIKPQ